jgi:hypothetical protein
MEKKNYKNFNTSFNKRIKTFFILRKHPFFNSDDCNIIFKAEKKGNIGDNKKYNYLTEGGQGSIYFMNLIDKNRKQYEIALKFVYIDDFLIKKRNKKNPNFRKWRELFVYKKCSKLVINKVTQNLPLLYHNQICKDKSSLSIMTYSEKADGNLIQWLGRKHSVQEWKSMLFQVWHGVDILQKKLKLVHNDLRLPNILFINTEKNEKYRYKIDDDFYYLNTFKNIFIIWDFGSCQTLLFPRKDYKTINNKLESNKDLHFIHDLYKRIRVLCLTNRYTMEDLENILSKNEIDKKYVIDAKRENLRKYKVRFKEKFKIAMAYFIIETNRFTKLYNNRINKTLDGFDKIFIPPEEIDNILKILSENYNYSYKDAISRYGPISRKIPSPKKLIDLFLPELKKKTDFTFTFQ